MNVVRFITEHPHFGNQFVKVIEESIKPLLQMAVDPQEISFEDDLIYLIDALIKKSLHCSQTLMDLFQCLKGFQLKYDGMLANLTNCLNSYVIFGSQFIQ